MATISAYGPMAAGHINPTLGIVAELVRRGHHVTYWAARAFADRITETGADFEPIDSNWEHLDGELPQMHGKEFVRAMGLLLDETAALVPQLAGTPRPDLVLHDGTLGWWARILARQWEVPGVEVWPNLVSNQHWSLNTYTKINPASPRFLHQLARTGRYLRRWGFGDVGEFFQGSSAAARLVTLPRSFQYAGDTFDGWHFVGPCLSERAFQGSWRPPDGGGPLLLVSLGTAYNARPAFYRMIVSSAAGRPWRVLMAIGDQVDRAELGPVPDNVEIRCQVPQLAALQCADAFVTHAGMGGVMEGIHHRVPLVAVPQMAEQRANADRIAALGLGRTLNPAGLDADTLWAAVTGVSEDAGIRHRLARMRQEMDAAGGATAAADVIDHVLQRA